MDNLKKKLLDNTYTVASAHRRLSLLRQVLEKVFFVADVDGHAVEKRYQDALEELSESDNKSLVVFGNEFLSDLSSDNLHQVLTDLRGWLDNVPTMTLYVPGVFSETQVAELGQWCRVEINDQLFLELSVNPAVVGGCAFVHNHTYYDMSLRARLNEDPNILNSILAKYESA